MTIRILAKEERTYSKGHQKHLMWGIPGNVCGQSPIPLLLGPLSLFCLLCSNVDLHVTPPDRATLSEPFTRLQVLQAPYRYIQTPSPPISAGLRPLFDRKLLDEAFKKEQKAVVSTVFANRPAAPKFLDAWHMLKLCSNTRHLICNYPSPQTCSSPLPSLFSHHDRYTTHP